MPIVIETFPEFAKRMACDHIADRGEVVFANGALSDGDARHTEPPTDVVAKDRLRLRYLKLKLAEAEIQHQRISKAVLAQAEFHQYGAGPAPEDKWPQWEADLERVTDEVHTLRRRIKKLTDIMHGAPSPPMPNHRAEARQRAQDAASRVFGLQI